MGVIRPRPFFAIFRRRKWLPAGPAEGGRGGRRRRGAGKVVGRIGHTSPLVSNLGEGGGIKKARE